MPCLTPEQIELLGRGELDTTEATPLRQHIDGCESCRRNLDEWLSNEEALRQLRRLSDSPFVCQAAGMIPSHAFPGYDVVREIHRGGQGVVYKAFQKTTKRTVALKVLLGGAFASRRQRHRFEREIDLIATLRHPNIVTVYDSGVTPDGQAYFAMEYIHGMPLNEYMRVRRESQPTGGRRVLDESLRLFAKICAAVNYAHQHGVIHRDLKPGNIRIDADGEPHVLDFGLAKAAGPALVDEGPPLTATSEFMGTLAYASPEQVKGDPSLVDIRADVYSLGVILYEMLTGEYPYPVVGHMGEVLRHIAETQPEPPSTWYRRRSHAAPHASRALYKIDHDLETIVLTALAKDKERRYQSTEHLGRDVERYLAGQPIDAKRDSAWYVVRKLAFRHRFQTAMLTTLVLVIGGFVAIAGQLYLHTRESAAEQWKSEQALVVTNLDIKDYYQQATDFVDSQEFAWFLVEWQEGRLDSARKIRDRVDRKDAGWYKAMTFLLDDTYDEQRLMDELPAKQRPLGCFVAAERHRKAARGDEAIRLYELSLQSPVSELMRTVAEARLRELRASMKGRGLSTAPFDGR